MIFRLILRNSSVQVRDHSEYCLTSLMDEHLICLMSHAWVALFLKKQIMEILLFTVLLSSCSYRSKKRI